jgi:hypothetical protein
MPAPEYLAYMILVCAGIGASAWGIKMYADATDIQLSQGSGGLVVTILGGLLLATAAFLFGYGELGKAELFNPNSLTVWTTVCVFGVMAGVSGCQSYRAFKGNRVWPNRRAYRWSFAAYTTGIVAVFAAVGYLAR